MAKQKKNDASSKKSEKSEAKKPTQRWMLGVFHSARSGDLIATYCRTDGTVAPMYAKTVKTKKALFAAKYVGMSYAEAREQLMKDAAKAGVRPPKVEQKDEEKAANPKLRRAA